MLDDVHKELIASIAKAHEVLRRDLGKLRAGRANTNLLDGIRVDYYGTMTPLAQMANIAVPEPRLLTVKPWDKTAIKAVEKALRENDMGLNPMTDGDLIRLPLPPLTEERRKDFVKVLGRKAEEGKVSIRKIRQNANDQGKALVKKSEVSEDDLKRAQDGLQKMTDRYIAEIDRITKAKEAELLEV